MDPTYTRDEIRRAFAQWLKDAAGQDRPRSGDEDECTETLCTYMEEARSQPEPT